MSDMIWKCDRKLDINIGLNPISRFTKFFKECFGQRSHTCVARNWSCWRHWSRPDAMNPISSMADRRRFCRHRRLDSSALLCSALARAALLVWSMSCSLLYSLLYSVLNATVSCFSALLSSAALLLSTLWLLSVMRNATPCVSIFP